MKYNSYTRRYWSHCLPFISIASVCQSTTCPSTSHIESIGIFHMRVHRPDLSDMFSRNSTRCSMLLLWRPWTTSGTLLPSTPPPPGFGLEESRPSSTTFRSGKIWTTREICPDSPNSPSAQATCKPFELCMFYSAWLCSETLVSFCYGLACPKQDVCWILPTCCTWALNSSSKSFQNIFV